MMEAKQCETVAPHDGCVDWNRPDEYDKTVFYWVAPHDGCVDWNRVTLLKKEVDKRRTPRWVRGLKYTVNGDEYHIWEGSHPTMGAWIEIYPSEFVEEFRDGRTPRWVRGLKSTWCSFIISYCFVAPHDGCVDWNLITCIEYSNASLSHPTMGAWIEIERLLRKQARFIRRTPRWVRGLKLSSLCL